MSDKNYEEGQKLKFNETDGIRLFGLPYTQMVHVAPGRYTMIDELNNNKKHEITFANGYFMGKYPVTQELYEAIRGTNPSDFKGKHRPVETVSWNDICKGDNSFLTKLNQKVKEQYGEIGTFGLPSEAQWEYAAAGGSHWDKTIMKYAGSNKLEDVGWFEKNSNGQTMPVGLKQPNALGLHDMSGNVWEWCQDYWTSNISDLPKNADPNPKSSNAHALRGGSCFNYRHYCRLRDRSSDLAGYRIRYNGFRLCFSPVHPDTTAV